MCVYVRVHDNDVGFRLDPRSSIVGHLKGEKAEILSSSPTGT